jgi:hypothetical protein
MLDFLWKRHAQSGLQMFFYNISPLGDQAQPGIFSKSEASQGHLRIRMGDGVSQSHASSLARGLKT